MLKLVNLPHDVFLKIAYRLDVPDILCVERTCTYLRDVVAARHLWLVKLHDLRPQGPPCAPDLPPHVDISALTTDELRGSVVRAVRTYCNMMKDPSTKAEYTSIRTITPTFPQRQHMHISSAKLAPGGRFLLMTLSSSEYYELRILDLQNEDRCIWSFDFGTDGSITLAILVQESYYGDRGVSLVHSLFKIFQLRPSNQMTPSDVYRALKSWTNYSSCNKTPVEQSGVPSFMSGREETFLQESVIAEVETTESGPFTNKDCVISGKYAFFWMSDDEVMITNWEENKVVRIHNWNGYAVSHIPQIQIYHDHLFYAEMCDLDYEEEEEDEDCTVRLCNFSLSQAMSLLSSSTSGNFDFSALDISYFEPTIYTEDGSLANIYHITYLFDDQPWKDDSSKVTAYVIVTTLESNAVPHVALLQTDFYPNRPATEKWGPIIAAQSTRFPGIPSSRRPYRNGPGFKQSNILSRSGRLLFHIPVVDGKAYGLVAIDMQGNLVFRHFSTDAPVELPAYLQDIVEPYSGIILALRSTESGNDFIDLLSSL